MMNGTIVLGGGCFWCLDASFRLIKGVIDVTSGYAGGGKPDPTYEEVSYGSTGHAEVVQLVYDANVVSLEQLLAVFWTIHDPTTLNRQGNDIGYQYRSVIYFTAENQLPIIEKSLNEAQSTWEKPIVTEIAPLDVFYPAESYHQNYFAKNPTQSYCQAIIDPKLMKLRQTYQELLR